MTRIRPILLWIVVVNALVALALWVRAIPMPGWFATVLALASIALVGSRFLVKANRVPA
jgi:hypothetical protein